MTPEEANAVYDVLQEECGAGESLRENFVHAQRTACPEYRFQGALGFGGKFRQSHGMWYVDCYREDLDVAREGMITRANERLARMRPCDGAGLLPRSVGELLDDGRYNGMCVSCMQFHPMREVIPPSKPEWKREFRLEPHTPRRRSDA